MPIKSEWRPMYGPDWIALARQLKEEAGWRCQGCDVRHGEYGYRDARGEWHPVAGPDALGCEPEEKIIRVVLTVHHVTPLAEGGTHDPANLRVYCCRCHNRADGPMRGRHAAATRAMTRRAAKVAAGQEALL
jgi:hypothetical protein